MPCLPCECVCKCLLSPTPVQKWGESLLFATWGLRHRCDMQLVAELSFPMSQGLHLVSRHEHTMGPEWAFTFLGVLVGAVLAPKRRKSTVYITFNNLPISRHLVKMQEHKTACVKVIIKVTQTQRKLKNNNGKKSPMVPSTKKIIRFNILVKFQPSFVS